jgi:hypothetical protein
MFDRTYYDAVYYDRRMSAQFKCVDICGEDGSGCLDAPQRIPAGSTRRIDRNEPHEAPFASQHIVLRDGWEPSIYNQ